MWIPRRRAFGQRKDCLVLRSRKAVSVTGAEGARQGMGGNEVGGNERVACVGLVGHCKDFSSHFE